MVEFSDDNDEDADCDSTWCSECRLWPWPTHFAGNLPRTRDVAGNPLPSPRLISTNVSTAESRLADVSNMVMAWGQFIDHDFTGTPVIKSKGNDCTRCLLTQLS